MKALIMAFRIPISVGLAIVGPSIFRSNVEGDGHFWSTAFEIKLIVVDAVSVRAEHIGTAWDRNVSRAFLRSFRMVSLRNGQHLNWLVRR
ncbi:hypothetical protein DFH06DRAFT_148399 [Mycena polygramma]|nr:hypothetical protein DFH06DRAFT_148399 [Mycena polygramma]